MGPCKSSRWIAATLHTGGSLAHACGYAHLHPLDGGWRQRLTWNRLPGTARTVRGPPRACSAACGCLRGAPARSSVSRRVMPSAATHCNAARGGRGKVVLAPCFPIRPSCSEGSGSVVPAPASACPAGWWHTPYVCSPAGRAALDMAHAGRVMPRVPHAQTLPRSRERGTVLGRA